MKNPFTHIVITRFNISNGDWLADKEGKEVRTDQWMEHRIGLFENICYTSLLNQTVTNYKWLIFLDEDTKSEYRLQLEELLLDHPFIHLKYVDGIDGFKKRIVDSVKSLIDGDSKFLITTRIDNDDALHREYLEKVQQSFSKQKLMAVNFPIGLQWGITNHRFYEVYNDSNPFISLIEKIDEGSKPLTVFHKEHRHYSEMGDFPITQRIENHLWLQAIHDSNVLNKVVGKEITQGSIVESFNLKLQELC